MRDGGETNERIQGREAMNNSEIFYEMKQHFLANRNEDTAIEVINNLLAQNSKEVDMDVWPDLQDLLKCLVETITIPVFVTKHQLLFLSAVNSSPGRVVDLLAKQLNQNIGELAPALASSHVAVTIAFTRRIVDPLCADTIALLLWRFAEIHAVQEELKNLLKTRDAEERFRIHQVAITALKEGIEGQKVDPLVKELSKELGSGDILSQLNAVELLADAASQKPSAASYLESTGVVGNLYNLLDQVTEHPDAGFLFPALIKFFGYLSAADVKNISKYPNFLRSLLDLLYHFDRLDASLRLLAFDTLAVIASSDVARIFLRSLSRDYDFDKAMHAFGAAVGSGPLEMRVRHIEALTMLLRYKAPGNRDASEVLERWFNELGEPFPSLVVAFLSKPFPEVRIAALRLLLEALNYDWAVRLFMNVPGFLECVLNRSTETDAEGKQLKFDVVCLLIESGSSIIAAEDMLKLKLYKREGPFYVERPPQIGMENE